MHRATIAASSLLIAQALSGCGPAASQAHSEPSRDAEQSTPAKAAAAEDDVTRAAATLHEMLDLAEAGDWGAYVDRFYGESHKFRGPEDRDALVQRFQQRWGEQVVEGLRQATQHTPVIDEQGRAVFADQDGQPLFMLFPVEDGHWSFHL